ncbi:MAG: nucleotidyltransferase family protein [Campylobacterota bacterium]|nr:nucleotidyltransferase family protein [Campylobacterota bacterium]
MTKLEATLALTKLIAPANKNIQNVQKELLSYETEEWEQIVSIANDDLLAPLLYKSLQRKQLYELIKDEQLKGFLKEIYKLNETRNIAILEQLHEISSILKTIGVKPTLLKGATALSEKHFENIGERAMTDIDFYVPDEKIWETIDILKEHGYKEIDPDYQMRGDWHHYKRMYRDDVAASIEIHRLLLKEESLKYFPTLSRDELFTQSSEIENAYVLKPTYELYYSFLHTEVSHMYHLHTYLALRHLQHFGVMVEKYRQEIDFDYLTKLTTKTNINDTWNDYLSVQNEFFELDVITKPSSYVQKIKDKLNTKHNRYLQLKSLITMILNGLSYNNLQKHYKFNNRAMMLLYVPHRVVKLLYIYTTDKTKKRWLFQTSEHLSS